MSNKLTDRIKSYQDLTDLKLLPRAPVIMVVNGNSFSKVTSLLDKPYDSKLAECIMNTMLRLCTDIEGVVFAYQHNDEIVLVTRNDQNHETAPWYNGRVQKICSVVSSIASLHFNRCANAIELNLINEAFFTCQVFVVPTIMEAINTLVCQQQHNFQTSIQFACFYELLKRARDKNTIREMLSGLSLDEKIDLLRQECQTDFNSYPLAFRRGTACYKATKAMGDGAIKNKWTVNANLPIFTKETSFLGNIMRMGNDIFTEANL
jgi:tRNA(His) 5'-end guanylyltransferase